MRFLGTQNPEYLGWYNSLPKDADGAVKDPRYLDGHRKATYLEAWRKWCSLNPLRKDWPDFLQAMALEAKVRGKS